MRSKFIDSINAVARRRYLGLAGETWLCNKTLVYSTILKGRAAASQLVSGYTLDFTNASVAFGGERTLSGIGLELKSNHISDSVIDRLADFDEEIHAPYKVRLPEQDPVPTRSCGRWSPASLFPPGSQSRLANA
ncbi:hypothetical protein ACFWAY_49300 [Rhodococcus sp. NPDC059968]|uniref:hypothetical protein n=1 Tax=Rhodococcus sp. NPDC059968 TaxID=3347017 RepID=UPI003672BDEA